MDNQLDIISKRLETLDSKVFKNVDVKEEFSKSRPILQVLSDSQDTLSSALAGQSKIQNFLQSLDKLNAVLDPNYENTFINSEVKTSVILNNYENIMNCLTSLDEFNKRKNTALGEDLSQMISSQPNLSKVIDQQIVVKSAVENQSKQINGLVLKYTSFMENLNNYILFVDRKLTELEIEKNLSKAGD